MTPELHRPVAVDRIGTRGLEVTVEADSTECAALARRMGIPAVRSLRCVFLLKRAPGDSFTAAGQLRAGVVQTCVVSLEDFATEVEEVFRLRFVPAGQEADDIDPEDPEDEVVYASGMLDLGEVAAEQLSLGLDPYPRKPGAVFSDADADVTPHPFDVLRRQ